MSPAPIRTCTGCGRKAPQSELIRFVARDPLNDTNTILMGSNAPITAAKLLGESRSLAPDLRPVAVRAAARLRPGLSGGTVYTDDHAPVEWLVDESLIQYAEKGG